MPRRAACGLVALLLAGSACSPDPKAPAPSPLSAQPAGKAAPAIGPARPLPAVASPRAPASLRVVLAGEGLQLVDALSGGSRPIDFGSSEAEVRQALETVLGPAEQEGRNAECGEAALMTWRNGLNTWSRNGRFVGWNANEPRAGASAPTTAASLGVGAQRRDLESSYVGHAARTTLGVEVQAGGVTTLFPTPTMDARASALWAGETCLAR